MSKKHKKHKLAGEPTKFPTRVVNIVAITEAVIILCLILEMVLG